ANAAQSFFPAYPDYFLLLRSQAWSAFGQAFGKLPVMILPKSKGVDFTVYVADENPNAGNDPGAFGAVYYFGDMEEAQRAAGAPCGADYCDWSPLISDRPAMYKLMVAIGTGLGRSAAHEVGHELTRSGLPLMDCGLGNRGGYPNPPQRACDDNNDN